MAAPMDGTQCLMDRVPLVLQSRGRITLDEATLTRLNSLPAPQTTVLQTGTRNTGITTFARLFHDALADEGPTSGLAGGARAAGDESVAVHVSAYAWQGGSLVMLDMNGKGNTDKSTLSDKKLLSLMLGRANAVVWHEKVSQLLHNSTLIHLGMAQSIASFWEQPKASHLFVIAHDIIQDADLNSATVRASLDGSRAGAAAAALEMLLTPESTTSVSEMDFVRGYVRDTYGSHALFPLALPGREERGAMLNGGSLTTALRAVGEAQRTWFEANALDAIKEMLTVLADTHTTAARGEIRDWNSLVDVTTRLNAIVTESDLERVLLRPAPNTEVRTQTHKRAALQQSMRAILQDALRVYGGALSDGLAEIEEGKRPSTEKSVRAVHNEAVAAGRRLVLERTHRDPHLINRSRDRGFEAYPEPLFDQVYEETVTELERHAASVLALALRVVYDSEADSMLSQLVSMRNAVAAVAGQSSGHKAALEALDKDIMEVAVLSGRLLEYVTSLKNYAEGDLAEATKATCKQLHTVARALRKAARRSLFGTIVSIVTLAVAGITVVGAFGALQAAATLGEVISASATMIGGIGQIANVAGFDKIGQFCGLLSGLGGTLGTGLSGLGTMSVTDVARELGRVAGAVDPNLARPFQVLSGLSSLHDLVSAGDVALSMGTVAQVTGAVGQIAVGVGAERVGGILSNVAGVAGNVAALGAERGPAATGFGEAAQTAATVAGVLSIPGHALLIVRPDGEVGNALVQLGAQGRQLAAGLTQLETNQLNAMRRRMEALREAGSGAPIEVLAEDDAAGVRGAAPGGEPDGDGNGGGAGGRGGQQRGDAREDREGGNGPFAGAVAGARAGALQRVAAGAPHGSGGAGAERQQAPAVVIDGVRFEDVSAAVTGGSIAESVMFGIDLATQTVEGHRMLRPGVKSNVPWAKVEYHPKVWLKNDLYHGKIPIQLDQFTLGTVGEYLPSRDPRALPFYQHTAVGHINGGPVMMEMGGHMRGDTLVITHRSAKPYNGPPVHLERAPTIPQVSKTMKFVNGAGKVVTAVGIATSTYRVATADDKVREAFIVGAGWVGSGLAVLGVTAGTGGVGVVGAVGAGVVGGAVAEYGMEKAYDAVAPTVKSLYHKAQAAYTYIRGPTDLKGAGVEQGVTGKGPKLDEAAWKLNSK